jgi:hypothetical protein
MEGSMNITITPPMVDAFLNLLVFGVGLDFTWCGYWFLKTNEITHLPKLFGYLMFKFIEKSIDKDVSKNETVKIVFSMKAVSIYMLLGGPLLIVGSAFALLSQFS